MAQHEEPVAGADPAAPAEHARDPDQADPDNAGRAEGGANRLINESSPYLLQHARNPVDWYPWGAEAFAEAARRGVPIFLSVGYSTCYWCHVMERESFEDPATAAVMNAKLVNIKVDREQRPDVDDIYMAAVQMLTGSGGWPMSVFLTPPGARGADDPGLEPIWGGTYFPNEPRANHPSFTMVLDGISSAWATRRAEVLDQADAITRAVRDRLAMRADPARIGPEQVSGALARLMSIHDATWGGFGSAPKFPQPVFLEFLFDVAGTITGDAQRASVADALRRTLDRMALGGMFDQVGGGFHRYSTDEKWLVPHFEKMLYDNALLLSVYARAAVALDDSYHGRVARRTADYILREMTDPDTGAFYSAQDAEVDAREGLNYLWTAAEITAVLDGQDAAFVSRVYRFDDGTNFRDPHYPGDGPKNVLWMRDRPAAVAESLGMSEAEFITRLDRVNTILYSQRATRKQPGLDDKVLAGWNGLMIAALADSGRLLDEPRHIEAAERAAGFILGTLRRENGELIRSWRSGVAGPDAVLDDYAFLIRGLIALDRATGAAGDGRYISAAISLFTVADRLFGDAEHGGWFDTAAGRGDLIVRARATYDGAVPSGQSVMLHNLLELYTRTGEDRFLHAASRGLASMSRAVAEAPLGPVEATRALIALLRIERSSGRALREEFGMGDAAPKFTPETPAKPPVQIFASDQEITVGADEPAELGLELRIDDGWHINAHEPGVADLAPLRVRVVGGTGVRAVVEYPVGAPLEAEWALGDDRPLVHVGSVALVVRLERTGEEWVGTPTIAVDYQACTNTMCAEPMTAALRVKIIPK